MDEVIQYRKVTNFNLIINISNMLLWTSTWLQDQKAGGGRLIYKGIKLNNRTMHNFRPTIGKLLNTVSRRFIWPSFVISAHTALLRNCLFVWNELNLLQEVLFVGTLCLWNRLSPFRPVRVNIQHLLRHPCCVMKGKYFCNRFECNEQ